MLDLQFLASFRESKLSCCSQLGKAINRKLSLEAAAHPDNLKCHRGLDL